MEIKKTHYRAPPPLPSRRLSPVPGQARALSRCPFLLLDEAFSAHEPQTANDQKAPIMSKTHPSLRRFSNKQLPHNSIGPILFSLVLGDEQTGQLMHQR